MDAYFLQDLKPSEGIYVLSLAWEHLGISQEERKSVAAGRDVKNTLLILLPLEPNPRKTEDNGWIERFYSISKPLLIVCWMCFKTCFTTVTNVSGYTGEMVMYGEGNVETFVKKALC